MSLDVFLKTPNTVRCDSCGHDQPLSLEGQWTRYDANITHNLGGMAKAAGLYEALWRPDLVTAPPEAIEQIRALEAKGQFSEAEVLRGKLPQPRARDLVEILRAGVARLRADPVKYRARNPDNGWGTYEGLIRFTEDYLSACEANPDAVVEVSR